MVSWLIHVRAMTHSKVPLLVQTREILSVEQPLQTSRILHDMTHWHVCHDSFTCVPWLIDMCAMTHSHACYDSFTGVPWLIYMCAMTHPHECHDSFTCVPWLIHMFATTHSHVSHDSFASVLWSFCMCTQTHSRMCTCFHMSYQKKLHYTTTAKHCNTLQHTAIHCNTPQHTCNTLQHTATHRNTLHKEVITQDSKPIDTSCHVLPQ